jgi:hypothetical protein
MTAPADAARFREQVDRAASVEVVAGWAYDAHSRKRNRRVALEWDADELTRLGAALHVAPGGARFDWMTTGEPTLALRGADDELLVVLTYLHPGYIRSSLLDGDSPLSEPDLLSGWLADHGWTHSV